MVSGASNDAGEEDAPKGGGTEARQVPAREVPTDPEQADDEVLKTGFQIVTGRYGKRAAGAN